MGLFNKLDFKLGEEYNRHIMNGGGIEVEL